MVVAVVVGTVGIVVGTVVVIVVGIVVAAVVVPAEDAVVGLTLPPVDSSRPAGTENGSLDPANDTGGSVSRGVGDGERRGGAVGTQVVPVAPVGPLGSARSSPPSGPSTKKDTMISSDSATPAISRILLSRGVSCMARLLWWCHPRSDRGSNPGPHCCPSCRTRP